MGKSFTSNHILNPDKLTKAQFKKKFTDMMKAKGYTKADADEAELSYALAFSSDRKWVTVLTEDSENSQNKTADFAKSLGMEVLGIELVDSDFAAISLFDKTGRQVDAMFLGDPYFDEVPEPSPLKWQTLLGIEWAQVEKILNKDYTFAEEALGEFAAVIGMDKENILLEYDEVDDSAVMMYFKKEGEKKLTLNTAFKQVFGELLEPLGFKRMKGSPAYYRIVNNEIVEIIACQKRHPVEISGHPITKGKRIWLSEWGIFNIFYRISTVYDEHMLLKIDSGCSGFNTVQRLYYSHYYQLGRDENYSDIIETFPYRNDNSISLMEAMKTAKEATTRILLPLFDKVKDIETMLFTFNTRFYSVYYSHDLYFLIKDYHEYFSNLKEHLRKDIAYKVEHGIDGSKMENYDEYCAKDDETIRKALAYLDSQSADPELYESIVKKLDDNKRKNLEILKRLNNTGEKKLTLNAAFKQVFGAELESRGFKLIKGGCMYVRVLNGEIVQFVTVQKGDNYPTCMPVKSDVPLYIDSLSGRKFVDPNFHYHFNVLCSIESIYSEIDFELNKFSSYGFITNQKIYLNTPDLDPEKSKKIKSFTYQKESNESILSAMEYCFEISKEVMLPTLDNLNNIDDLILFYRKSNMLFIHDLYYKCSDYLKIIEREYDNILANTINYIRHNYSDDVESRIKIEREKIFEKRKQSIDKVEKKINDKEKYKTIINELDINKQRNLETLYSLKIINNGNGTN